MAYTPTTWVTGDTVTATKMNKIENGIANAGGEYDFDVVIGASDTNFTSSTTFTLVKGTASAVWNKLTNGEYARALLIADGSWATFQFVLTYESWQAAQTSTEGIVVFYFFDRFNNQTRTIGVDSNGAFIY